MQEKMPSSQETCRPAFPDQEEPRISFGLPFHETCRKHVEETFHASKVYIIASNTLANKTNALKDLKTALDGRIAGVRVGMRPHTFMSEVLDITHEARKVDADLIVTLGAGSLSDAAKIIALALGNDVETEEDLLNLPSTANRDAKAKPPKCPVICIPTSLSGGEYSDFAGVTRDSDHEKIQFMEPLQGPRLIILDADLAVSTPLRMWIGSGVRALDHCVEALCGSQRDELADDGCIKGLNAVVPGLLLSKQNPSDAHARHESQIGVNFAMVPLHRTKYTRMFAEMGGASHGIGHMLGPLGVAHGETSCILLPAVCKYNAQHDSKRSIERQNIVSRVLWGIDVARETFERRGLKENNSDLGDLIDAIVRELDMPRTLTEVGIGRDKLDQLAENSLRDIWVWNNPAPLRTKEQVMDILEQCI
ncbi:Dehydroquinate synthase-like protein [Xylona heveae TC161]|uniref:Dehydroquinate synthase-like protein n=1 Tax=Xylona heveae (strain CBS 132557 / TC161) TaxID=1328760 RepID=A0A165ILB6_XYLHT|nr:Dehydroquinate synthase-like protein [Xylona heveae TC161]KZF25061.1 Dehydroquinate synthase-like protein [Xylona heveae TC161]